MTRLTLCAILLLLLAAVPSLAGTGGDMTFCELFDLRQFGREGAVTGLSIATTSWNVGTADLLWFPSPASEHPFIVMNLYRVKADRFEQIGQSWVKHGFFAMEASLCGGSCTYEPGHSAGNWLGTGCTDTYVATLNALQNGLGPRYEVNPWTGGWSHAGSHFTQPGVHDGISHRLQVHDDDLDPAQNAGASYYAESYYVVADDDDVTNNAAWKPVTVSGTPGGTWTFGMSDRSVPPNIGFAIDAWAGASQTTIAQEVPPVEFVSPDGRCILAAKAEPVDAAFWRYEFAILNVDMDRQLSSFRLAVHPEAVVKNASFHGVLHHDEPVNAPSGSPINNADWVFSAGLGQIGWSTATNPLRWGTVYSFSCQINVAPVSDAVVSVGHFKPGLPLELFAQSLGPSTDAPDCNGNLIDDFMEIAAMPSLDCDGNAILDECDPDCDGAAPIDACVISDCLGDPACSDCNGNGIPDSCDLSAGAADCNTNGIPDACEISDTSSAPGGPFFCQIACDPDCNENGVPDSCDIAGGLDTDCDANLVPDKCQIAADPGMDCNSNGLLDTCGETDCNLNLIPDDCEGPSCAGILAGDMDCSGVVDLLDLAEFVEYLLDGTPSCRADMDSNGVVDGRDVDGFVDVAI